MYCIEPEELLINIYKNGMTYEPYRQDIAKLFNLIFLGRLSGVLVRIDYMEPRNLVLYSSTDGIEHPNAQLFWQEKDYSRREWQF